MTDTLTIGQLARATSVAPRTIRYYEAVGVLPPARRSPAGYRTYDRRAVERLLFVRRARALGLPLRRLRALSAALDGGPRSALRPRLLGVVREQLEAVRRRMSELERLRDQLEGVAERLAASRGPGGADGCRCLDAAGAG